MNKTKVISSSLSDSHFPILKTSAYVTLSNGDLKRRRNKDSYMEIYLERKSYREKIIKGKAKSLNHTMMNMNVSSLHSKYDHHGRNNRYNDKMYLSFDGKKRKDILKEINDSKHEEERRKKIEVVKEMRMTKDLSKFITKNGRNHRRYIDFEKLVTRDEDSNEKERNSKKVMFDEKKNDVVIMNDSDKKESSNDNDIIIDNKESTLFLENRDNNINSLHNNKEITVNKEITDKKNQSLNEDKEEEKTNQKPSNDIEIKEVNFIDKNKSVEISSTQLLKKPSNKDSSSLSKESTTNQIVKSFVDDLFTQAKPKESSNNEVISNFINDLFTTAKTENLKNTLFPSTQQSHQLKSKHISLKKTFKEEDDNTDIKKNNIIKNKNNKKEMNDESGCIDSIEETDKQNEESFSDDDNVKHLRNNNKQGLNEKFTFNTEDDNENTIVNYIDEKKKKTAQPKPQKSIKRYKSMALGSSAASSLANRLSKMKNDVDETKSIDSDSQSTTARRMSQRLNSYRKSIMVVEEKLKRKETLKKKAKEIPKFNETEYQIRKRRRTMGEIPMMSNQLEEVKKNIGEKAKKGSLTQRTKRRASMKELTRKVKEEIAKKSANNRKGSGSESGTERSKKKNSAKNITSTNASSRRNKKEDKQKEEDDIKIENNTNENNEEDNVKKLKGLKSSGRNINPNNVIEEENSNTNDNNNIGGISKLRHRRIQSISEIRNNKSNNDSNDVEAFSEAFNNNNVNSNNNLSELKQGNYPPLAFLSQNYNNFAKANEKVNDNSIKMFSKCSYPSPIPNVAISNDINDNNIDNNIVNNMNINDNNINDNDDKLNRLFYKLFSKVRDQHYFNNDNDIHKMMKSQSQALLFSKNNLLKNSSTNLNEIHEKNIKIKESLNSLHELVNGDLNNSTYRSNKSKNSTLKSKLKKMQKQTERERYKMQISSSKILKTKSIFDNVYHNTNRKFLNDDYNSNCYDDYISSTHRSKSSSNHTYKYISKYINNIANNNNANNEKYKMLSSSQSLRNIHIDYKDNNEYMNQLKKDLYLYEQSKVNKTKTMVIDERIFYKSNVEVCPPNAMDAERFEFFKG